MNVVKVVDQDIADKVDTQYIEEQFSNVENVSIIYICTREGGEEDAWIDEFGVQYIVIHLPYKQVKNDTDIKPLMLMRAKEKLGLVA